MSEVYVSGHGGYSKDAAWVRVPPGVTVVFYADMDAQAVAAVTRAVLNAGDITQRQEYHAGDLMPNYGITPPHKDIELAVELASVSSRFKDNVFWVGDKPPLEGLDQVWMCDGDILCREWREPEEGHAPECSGLFRLFPEATSLHLLACRGEFGKASPATFEMDAYDIVDPESGTTTRTSLYGASSRAYVLDLTAEVMRILQWAGTDPQAALEYVESLPQASLASLHSEEKFTRWLEAMRHPLTSTSPQADIDTLAQYIRSLRNDKALVFWRALPVATRQVLADRAENTLTDFLDHLDGITLATFLDNPDALPSSLQTTGHPPVDFTAAWADDAWRNHFWQWLADHPPTDVNADALLALHRRLPDPIPTPDQIQTTLEDLHFFFTNRWNNPPEPIAQVAAAIEDVLADVANMAARLNADPDLPQPIVEKNKPTAQEILQTLITATFELLNNLYLRYRSTLT
ncbi:MAG: hypothetical protein H0T78_07735 [Longispora sp.]|nr:hypothetical protein [Longispora sp. (in: high G+C Gram-positive bacteria)]